MNNPSNLMASIAAILQNNGLTELRIEDYGQLNDSTYIIWFDNDGVPYDDPVVKVMVEGSSLSVEVEAREFAENVTLQDYDIDRLEWWRGIHANILEVLQRDGKRRCPTCGKPLKGKQKFCSETCWVFAAPPPTAQEIADKANKHIQTLIDRITKGDRKLKRQLTEKYIIKL